MAVFKKILASTLALAAIAAAGTTAVAADNVYTQSWDVDYTYGAPSYVSKQVSAASLTYIGVGYQTTTARFNGNGDGYVIVRVKDKQRWMITGAGTVPKNLFYNIGYQFDYSDAENGFINFQIVAVGQRVTASGTIHGYGYSA